jgi:hypothetical protein
MENLGSQLWVSCFVCCLALVEARMARQTDTIGVLWRCLDCDYSTRNRRTLFEHVESKHVYSAGYVCKHCQKHCPSRNALRSHVSRYHKDVTFSQWVKIKLYSLLSFVIIYLLVSWTLSHFSRLSFYTVQCTLLAVNKSVLWIWEWFGPDPAF